MLFVSMMLFVFAAASLVAYWQQWRIRTLQWRVLAVRDELRDAAIADPQFAKTKDFSDLDLNLTVMAENLADLSFWSIAAAGALRPRPKTRRHIGAPDARCEPYVKEMHGIFANTLVAQHIVLCTFLALTIVGVVPLHWAYRRSLDVVRALGPMGGSDASTLRTA